MLETRGHQLPTYEDFKTDVSSKSNCNPEWPVDVYKGDGFKCKNLKFLVYYCNTDCGGYADRQKGIVSTYLMALLTGRKFVIVLQKPCELENFFLPHAYNWLECKNYVLNASPNKTQRLTVYDQPGKFRRFLSNLNFQEKWTSQIVEITINFLVIDIVRKHLEKNPLKQLSWIRNVSPDFIISTVLNLLFRRNPSFDREIKNFFRYHVKNKSLSCAHIRIGRNPSIPTDRIFDGRGHPNLTTIISFLDKFKDKEKYVLYLASDTNDVKSMFSSKFNNIVYLNKTVVHVDKLKGSEKEGCDGFHTAILEQTLLSKCDTLVLTTSGFNQVASYLRGTDKQLFLYKKESNTVDAVTLIEYFNRF